MDSESTEPTAPIKKSRKRVWLRRLAIVVGVFVIIALLVNGPVARYTLKKLVNDSLADQGMEGDFQIEGALLSGFTLSDFEYSGEEGVQDLAVKSAVIDYSLADLLAEKVELVKVSGVKVTVDSAKFKDAPDEETPAVDWREILTQVRPWVINSELELQDVDFRLLDAGKNVARLTFASFEHQSESEHFSLQQFYVKTEMGETPVQDTELTWNPQKLEVTKLQLLPRLSLEKVKVGWKDALTGLLDVHFAKSKIAVELDDAIQLKFAGEALSSSELEKHLGIQLPAKFLLEKLDLAVLGWQEKKPVDWEVSGSLHLPSLAYEKYELSNVRAELKQIDTSYSISGKAELLDAFTDLKIEGKWLGKSDDDWWSSSASTYMVELNLGEKAKRLFTKEQLLEGLDVSKGKVTLAGNALMNKKVVSEVTCEANVAGLLLNSVRLPNVLVNGVWSGEANSESLKMAGLVGGKSNPSVTLDAEYLLSENSYNASIEVNEKQLDWVNAIIKLIEPNTKLVEHLALGWNGSGSIEKSELAQQIHHGQCVISSLHYANGDNAPVGLISEMKYDWPKSLTLKKLTASQQDWTFETAANWDGKTLGLKKSTLKQKGELLGQLKGKLPYNVEITDLNTFLAQKEQWQLDINTEQLQIPRLAKFLPTDALKGISGSLKTDLKLTGTPATPEITGALVVKDVKGIKDGDLEALSLETTLNTDAGRLKLNGKMLEGETERVLVDLDLPFTPQKWLEKPDGFTTVLGSQKVSGKAKILKLPLSRVAGYVDAVSNIQGHVEGEFNLSGTLSEPRYLAKAKAVVPLVKLTDGPIGEVKNTLLELSMGEDMKLLGNLKSSINGGKFESEMSVDLADLEAPRFDVNLKTEHALIHRDDQLSIRANADVRLLGTIDNATISGQVGLVESLFYKDVELIPVGVPSSAVQAVKLPSMAPAGANEELPIPKPFSDWKLDLKVFTKDPVLVRGNIAGGQIEGSVKIKGILKKPSLDGTFYLNKVTAKLPFSVLKVNSGKVIFKPNKGFIPNLEVKGKSTIGSYSASLYVYGPADNPKTAFSSFPPLPESEIMTLLATGSTTAGLENRDVASFKAFQLFLLELQQRSNKPGGNKLFKRLLSGVGKLDMKVGEVDDFTGRKFASASIELHPRWHLTAQLDDGKQTRGLVVYILRFR